jgi:hypothetical protein
VTYHTFAGKEELLSVVKDLCTSFERLSEQRENNRAAIVKYHTYACRAEQIVSMATGGVVSKGE